MFLTAETMCLKSCALLCSDTSVSESLFVIVDVEEMEKTRAKKIKSTICIFFIFTLTY